MARKYEVCITFKPAHKTDFAQITIVCDKVSVDDFYAEKHFLSLCNYGEDNEIPIITIDTDLLSWYCVTTKESGEIKDAR